MRLITMAAITPLLLVPILSFSESAARADVYRWTDAQGVMHFTDSPENIPPEFRAAQEAPAPAGTVPAGAAAKPPADGSPAAPPEKQVSVKETGPEEAKPEEAPAETGATPDAAVPIETLDNFGRGETWWRDRKKFWEQRLADAQRLHDEARRQVNRVNQRHDSREYKQMKLLRERMDTLEGEIAKAQEMLGGGLAREARKAGAPPGWVR